MRGPKQPPQVPLKKIYQPTSGTPQGNEGVPRFTYQGKPLKGV